MNAERRRSGAPAPLAMREGDVRAFNSPGLRFFDTNVVVYAFDARDPRKQAVADALVREALLGRRGCISWQVVQEWMNVVLRKAAHPLSHAEARSALDVQQRYGFAVYDSLIVAAALRAGCSELLSEDLQHGQRIESMVVRNPFLA
jgi:predicted nucleic acid-binding protein